jgi:hypothetical protein
MTSEAHRPWLEIPVPDYIPTDPEEWQKPVTRGNEEYEEPSDEEKRVIIIDL